MWYASNSYTVQSYQEDEWMATLYDRWDKNNTGLSDDNRIDSMDTTENSWNFTFFEPCIVIYLCNKNQQKVHFLY